MANILYVVGALTGAVPTNASELAFRDWLVGEGHTVTCRDDNNADKTATGFDLVILSSNTSSANLAGYASVTQPVLNLAHATWDTEFGLWTGGTSAVSNNATTDINDPDNVAVGAIYSIGSNVRYVNTANMGGDATILYRYPVLSTSVAAWFYASGELLADGVTAAPGNRMAAFPLNESIANLTTLGWTTVADLIDITINGLTPPPSDTEAPTVPTGLSGSATGQTVNLTWTASTDNVAVTGYKVYRSTVSGFTPDGATLRGTSATNSYSENFVSPNTYYYKVLAYDAAGNESAASAQSAAIVVEESGGGGGEGAILFVVSDITTPAAGDADTYAYLTGQGYTVTYRAGANADKTVAGFDAVLISDSVPSADAAGYASAAVGIVNTQWTSWDEFGFIPGATSPLSSAALPNFRPVAHAITTMADRTPESQIDTWGGVTVAGRYVRNNTSYFPSPAQPGYAAMLADSTMNVGMFTFEAGAPMTTGTAAARRVGASMPHVGRDVATLAAFNYLEAALLWAMGQDVSDTLAPTAPTNAMADIDLVDVVQVTWSAATDNVGVAVYDVHRLTEADPTPAVGNKVGTTTGLSFTNTGVPVGYFRWAVIAKDAAGNSSPPALTQYLFVGGIDPDVTAPSRPTLTATALANTVSLTVGGSVDNVGVDHYTLHRSATDAFTPDSGNLIATVATPQTIVDTPPSAATWHYRALAYDFAGNVSLSSDEKDATTTDDIASDLYMMVSGVLKPVPIYFWNGSALV